MQLWASVVATSRAATTTVYRPRSLKVSLTEPLDVLVNSRHVVLPLGLVMPIAIRKHFTLAVPVMVLVVPTRNGLESEPVMVNLQSPHLVQ